MITHDKATFSTFKLNLILLLVAVAGILAPISSAIYFPALPDIQDNLRTTEPLVFLSASGFMLGMGLAPLAWGTISDAYGRRGVFLWTTALFVLSSIGCGISKTIELLISMRTLQGISSSAAMVTGVSVIIEIFPATKRGSAIGMFLIGPLIGPIAGPILGGFLNQYFGWQYIFWFLGGLGAVVLLCLLIYLPETLPDVQRKPYPFRINLFPPTICRTGPILNPLLPLVYMKQAKVCLIVTYACLTFSAYHFVASIQVIVMKKVYNLSSFHVGLSYLPLGIGNIVGSTLGGYYSDAIMRYYTAYKPTQLCPEVRLYAIVFGIVAFLFGLVMAGFSLAHTLPLAVTLFAQFLIGFGMTNIFTGISTYLIDLFPCQSSSIMACSACLRTVSAAVVSGLGPTLINHLGYKSSYCIMAVFQLPGIIGLGFLVFSSSPNSSD
ncbi:Dityrosine transporter 1 [Entomophthora muscae]|uniref:Dityrosine transporter 1 n=1 Tax=Entomophthora muscae TaxID=34485 RepID=A0ACC2TR74_9FUNG|nr:Dityrosine transporter 1 [Entomophthora muscae]